MFIEFLLDVFNANTDKDAIVWKDNVYDYGWLLRQVNHWQRFLADKQVEPGKVIAIEADFSPNAVALFLALVEHRCIIVPFTSSAKAQKDEFMELSQVQISFVISEDDTVELRHFDNDIDHVLYQKLISVGHPGLVLFSSGSTGKSKAAVHDLSAILEKFKVPRHSLRTITFLLYDHIGGINTMFYTLANSGCIVTVQQRSPDDVLNAVDRYDVELLPTTPTFLNLILISEAWKRYSLKSLRIISYGTEPMPQSTLQRFSELFPDISLLQTYGLSEVGILSSKSKERDSLWMKIGGDGFQTRIVAGILQIKSRSAMLGYLNAPNPFTDDGWFNTGDMVEVDGDYIKILGRKSEVINVGGEKVYPAEVESVIQEMEDVAEVIVRGVSNPIMGNIVCAKVRLVKPRDEKNFIIELKKHCSKRLQRYKVPVKITFADQKQYNSRFKKNRSI